MTDRPLICTAEDVLAILDGRKTVTRQVIIPVDKGLYRLYDNHGKTGKYAIAPSVFDKGCAEASNGKYYRPHRIGPGDTLWVREAVRCVSFDGEVALKYVADGSIVQWLFDGEERHHIGKLLVWQNKRKATRPSIFMPQCFSRITLEVVSMRAERLQDITDEDARLEGIGSVDDWTPTSTAEDLRLSTRDGFQDQWDKRHAKHPERQWAANPWVWRVEFLKQRSE